LKTERNEGEARPNALHRREKDFVASTKRFVNIGSKPSIAVVTISLFKAATLFVV